AAAVDGTAIASGATVVEGSNVDFTATPAAGYRVKEWTLNGSAVTDNTSTSYTVTDLAGIIAVTVEFELIPPTTYTVTYSVTGGNGKLAAAVDGTAIASGATVVEGKEVLFTATPDSGYQVKEWILNSSVVAGHTSTSYTALSLADNITVTVEFELIPPTSGYLVSVSAYPTQGGTVTGGGYYETGDRVKVSATAKEDYAFVYWTEGEGSPIVSKGETYTFRMDKADRDLVAHFVKTEPVYEWLVTVSAKPSEGGTVSGGGTFKEGDPVEVIATANDGYRFINWTEGQTEVSTVEIYSFTMGTSERSLTANFLAEGTGWPKGVRLSATNVTAKSVTLVLSQPVPDAVSYRVYGSGESCKEFDASKGTALLMDELDPMTAYTFTVQAVYENGLETSETSDGPTVKVKTKK
ncbi:MAG: hypothetical protein SCK57_03260, partial [Bacillota bacterium]|nr:hypothetical protein [Bacillota bacterium]